MKDTFVKALSMLTLSIVTLTSCATAESAAPPEPEPSSTVEAGFDIQEVVDNMKESSGETIVASGESTFNIQDHRAQLKSVPKPTSTPEPSPEPEQAPQQSGGTAPANQGQSSQNSQSNAGNSASQGGSSSGGSGQQSSQPAQQQPAQQPQQQQSQQQNNSSRGVNGVYNLTTARNYLASSCPRVGIESVQGNTSYYDPNRGVIMLGTNMRGGEGRIFFVMLHELMHHYQANYYSTDEWNAKLRNGTLETEADRMTFAAAPGLVGQGHYTNTPASGAELSRIQTIMQQGRAAGC